MKSEDANSMKSFYAHEAQRRRWGKDLVEAGLYPTERELIARHFPSSGKILNVGCGGGRECLALAEMGYEVAAVDIDEQFVEWTGRAAEEKGLALDCRIMDAQDLDFPDGAFDAVVMVGQLIGHVRGHENRLRVLEEALRVTRQGGPGLFSTNAVEAAWKYRAYFGVVNFLRRVYNPRGFEPNDAFVFRSGETRRFFGHAKDDPVFHWYRVEEFQADLRDAGWKPYEWLRRKDFEKSDDHIAVGEVGETFHMAGKLL